MTTPSGGRHTEREIIDSRQEYDILIPPPTLFLQQPYLKIASCLSAFVCVWFMLCHLTYMQDSGRVNGCHTHVEEHGCFMGELHIAC